jgi:DNA mismatch endonuclease Vsr
VMLKWSPDRTWFRGEFYERNPGSTSAPSRSTRIPSRPVHGKAPGFAESRDGPWQPIDESTSRRMAAVRRDGTRPELLVRKAVRSVGARYTIKNRDLPGSPDLANRYRRWAIFVHGCFWVTVQALRKWSISVHLLFSSFHSDGDRRIGLGGHGLARRAHR